MPLAYDVFVHLFNHTDKISIIQGGIGSEMKLSYDKTYVYTYLYNKAKALVYFPILIHVLM